jgi:hypothetical protein
VTTTALEPQTATVGNGDHLLVQPDWASWAEGQAFGFV